MTKTSVAHRALAGTTFAALVAASCSVPALAAAPVAAPTTAEATEALDLAMKAIAIRSDQGKATGLPMSRPVPRPPGRRWLGAVRCGHHPDARHRHAGRDLGRHRSQAQAAGPVGHMDVVEAKRADWQRDPFGPVVEDGVLGRGATDMKFDGSMLLSSLVDLRRHGYRPRRTIVLAFSGDEETVMATSAVLADKLKGAEAVINADGGGGTFADGTDKPLYWMWDGAEKSYADYKLEVTNPGGHSSEPRPDNAIVQLAEAVIKVGKYQFPPEQNAITKAYSRCCVQADPAKAAAMRAFAANPANAKALAVLRAEPRWSERQGRPAFLPCSRAGTRQCLAPAGRRQCQLPHLPGHSRAEIAAQLEKVIACRWSRFPT
jgi:hypothetical protein